MKLLIWQRWHFPDSFSLKGDSPQDSGGSILNPKNQKEIKTFKAPY